MKAVLIACATLTFALQSSALPHFKRQDESGSHCAATNSIPATCADGEFYRDIVRTSSGAIERILHYEERCGVTLGGEADVDYFLASGGAAFTAASCSAACSRLGPDDCIAWSLVSPTECREYVSIDPDNTPSSSGAVSGIMQSVCPVTDEDEETPSNDGGDTGGDDGTEDGGDDGSETTPPTGDDGGDDTSYEPLNCPNVPSGFPGSCVHGAYFQEAYMDWDGNSDPSVYLQRCNVKFADETSSWLSADGIDTAQECSDICTGEARNCVAWSFIATTLDCRIYLSVSDVGPERTAPGSMSAIKQRACPESASPSCELFDGVEDTCVTDTYYRDRATSSTGAQIITFYEEECGVLFDIGENVVSSVEPLSGEVTNSACSAACTSRETCAAWVLTTTGNTRVCRLYQTAGDSTPQTGATGARKLTREPCQGDETVPSPAITTTATTTRGASSPTSITTAPTLANPITNPSDPIDNPDEPDSDSGLPGVQPNPGATDSPGTLPDLDTTSTTTNGAGNPAPTGNTLLTPTTTNAIGSRPTLPPIVDSRIQNGIDENTACSTGQVFRTADGQFYRQFCGDAPVGEFSALGPLALETCVDRCTIDVNCVGWSWGLETRNCYLFSSTDMDFLRRPKRSLVERQSTIGEAVRSGVRLVGNPFANIPDPNPPSTIPGLSTSTTTRSGAIGGPITPGVPTNPDGSTPTAPTDGSLVTAVATVTAIATVTAVYLSPCPTGWAPQTTVIHNAYCKVCGQSAPDYPRAWMTYVADVPSAWRGLPSVVTVTVPVDSMAMPTGGASRSGSTGGSAGSIGSTGGSGSGSGSGRMGTLSSGGSSGSGTSGSGSGPTGSGSGSGRMGTLSSGGSVGSSHGSMGTISGSSSGSGSGSTYNLGSGSGSGSSQNTEWGSISTSGYNAGSDSGSGTGAGYGYGFPPSINVNVNVNVGSAPAAVAVTSAASSESAPTHAAAAAGASSTPAVYTGGASSFSKGGAVGHLVASVGLVAVVIVQFF